MPSSRILISSQTLSSTAATVTFSSIPATYTNLVLKYSARCDAAVTFRFAYLKVNGSSTSYSETYLMGDGASATSSRASSQTFIGYLRVPGTSATASTFSNGELYIPSYTASQNKPMSVIDAAETNATTAYILSEAALWQNTATISSVTFGLDGSGSLVSGSSFYLYGIKNS
jgi:hypothetical protein